MGAGIPAAFAGTRAVEALTVVVPGFRLRGTLRRRSPVRLRAKRFGETSTKLEARSRGGGGQPGQIGSFHPSSLNNLYTVPTGSPTTFE